MDDPLKQARVELLDVFVKRNQRKIERIPNVHHYDGWLPSTPHALVKWLRYYESRKASR